MILIPRFFLTGCLHWSATEKTKVTKATVSELFATETFLNLAEETKAVIEAAVGVFRKFNRSWSETKVVISDEDFFREKHLRNVFRKLLTVFIEFKSVNTYWVGRQIIFSEMDLTFFQANHIYLYTWCECYMRCDWSLPMIYWSTDTWMISQETCLLCFVEHGTRFWKCFWDYFGLREVKASKKLSKSYLQRKRALYDFGMSKLQEIFTTVAIVCHCYKRLTVFRHDSALSKKRRWNTSKKLYTSKIKKKSRSRDEI